MNHFIFALLTLSCISQAMNTQEQLRSQLCDITFHGKYAEFAQQRSMFQKELEYHDLLKAKQQCDRRLLALKDINPMYADIRIKNLVTTMQEQMRASNECLFAYIDEAEKRYKLDDTPEQELMFSTAAEILRSIELRATSYTGDYLIDLQAKIAQAPQPLIFLKVETENTTQLQNALQRTLRNKVGHQLHQIVFDGNFEAFQQNKEQFKKTLDTLDLVRAQENCKLRLFAIESIKKMRTNQRFNLLIMSMEQDQALPMLDMSVSVNKYRKDYSFDEAKAALDIYYATYPPSAIYNGCFADIQEKIANESDPDLYLEKEKRNILQLRDALQKSLPDMTEELKEIIGYVQRGKTLRFTKDYFTTGE